MLTVNYIFLWCLVDVYPVPYFLKNFITKLKDFKNKIKKISYPQKEGVGSGEFIKRPNQKSINHPTIKLKLPNDDNKKNSHQPMKKTNVLFSLLKELLFH